MKMTQAFEARDWEDDNSATKSGRRKEGGVSFESHGIYMESSPWSLEQKAKVQLSVSG